MLEIRPLRESDSAEEIGNLFSQLSNGSMNTVSIKALVNSSTKCIVAVDREKIIGFGSLVCYYLPTVGEVGKIEDIIINEKYRGQGLGKKLMEKIFETAKEYGLLRLQLTSSPRRTAARQMYQSLGFEMKDTNVFVKDM